MQRVDEHAFTVRAEGVSFQLSGQASRSVLAVLAASSRVFVPAACGGRGTCGKCVVRAAATGGMSVPISPEDRRVLSQEQLADGVRLACRLPSTAVGTVEIIATSDAAFTKAEIPDIRVPIKPIVERRRPEGSLSLEDQRALLTRVIGTDAAAVRLPELRALAQQPTAVTVTAEDSPLLLGTAEESAPLFGLAIDIGTTTIGCYLVDLAPVADHTAAAAANRIRAARSALNRQAVFGADVLSRISHAAEGGLDELRRAVLGGINTLIEKLVEVAGLSERDIAGITVAGNTTMLHLLLGVDPHGIGRAPFIPVFTEALRLRASELDLDLAQGAATWILPSISAYVGSDIVSAIVAEDLDQTDESILMIDVGTNGELVLVHGKTIYACSTAAGPAFEGATISHGVGGVAGAIATWTRSASEFQFETIAKAPPVGVCGSALLDVAAQLLDDGVVDETGRLLAADEIPQALSAAYAGRLQRSDESSGSALFTLSDGITVSQGDLRELQLAKAAIAAGIDVLLDRAGISAADLDRIVLTGGFGHHLNVNSAMRIGLLPALPSERVLATANAAGVGAAKALLQRGVIPRMRAVAKRAQHIELSALPEFQDKYIDHMVFPEKE
jgi:uncharacterized 2Fe-2S/4Fe-4S cluster protein (DUF4445 family)